MAGSKEHYDVIVIGGGASGMMAAGRAAERGQRVLLIEKNKKLGAKLSISGGGRCNITNAEDDEKKLLSHYGEAEAFLYSPFSQFGMKDTFTFFESRGLPLIVQGNKRAFPKTEKASDVVRVLAEYLKKGNVEVLTGVTVEKVVAKNGMIEKVIAGGKEFRAASYVFATGGLSHPETGSTGDGFNWLQNIGHSVEKPTPTIVPLRIQESWVKRIAGITVPDMKIHFFVNGERKFFRRGPLLFTHFGISGPTILNSSGKVADMMHEGMVTAVVDLYPDENIGSLDKKLTGIFDANKNKLLKNVFREIVPSGAAEVLLSLVKEIDPETKVHSVTKEGRRKLVDMLKAVPLTVSGLMGYDRAIVADGGVHLTEIDMKTMRSRQYKNLFVTGDLLHIKRPSGGYSLQLCWTTGFVAGNSC
jgi:predicted Rossmann fold flavoprotein